MTRPPSSSPPDHGSAAPGVAYALAAFLFWGGVPIYFKAVGHVSPLEVLTHRVIWSVVLLGALIALAGRWRDVGAALRDRRTRGMLLLTTAIISVNWLVFIWAIGAGRVLETSLGYYINPLVNVLLGVVILREKVGPWRGLAIVLAAVGVINLALGVEGFPWVALTLAFTFGVYGLIRKMISVGPVEGLLIETLILLPIALAYALYLAVSGTGAFGTVDLTTNLLLLASGAVTAAPLIWFTAAARRLDYSTVGFFQYIAPTGHFLLAVFAYGEAFTSAHLVTFACIWTGLAIYSIRTLMISRRQRAAQAAYTKSQ